MALSRNWCTVSQTTLTRATVPTLDRNLCGEEAYQHVQEERQLLDQLYEESSPQEQAAMITAFVISSEMEYAFGKWPIHTKPGLVNTKTSRLVLVTNDLFLY